MAHPRFEADRSHRSKFTALVAIVLAMVALSATAALATEEPAEPSGEGTAEETEGETIPGVPDDTLRLGAAVYSGTCSSCHQAGGVGIDGQFPPLVGNSNVDDADYVRQVILEGRQGPLEVNGVSYDGLMPSFSTLSDEEVEALVVYVTNGFARPAVVVEESVGSPDADAGLPGLANQAYVLAMLIAAGVGVYILGPRVVARVDRLEMTWVDAWMKTSVIVVGFIIFTVFVPSEALRISYVSKLGEFGQNIVGVTLWGGALAVGIWALWYAHRDRRI